MRIKVVGYSKFKAVRGNQVPVVLEIEKGTLRDALEILSRQHGKKFDDLVFDPLTKEEKRSNLILLNGQSHLNLRDRLCSELKDGDEISLLPVVIGG
jgi:molybdopterin converting factor small subunit